MAALVTLSEAKAQVRVTSDDEDDFIALQTEAATDIVIDYIKRPDHGWDDGTAPPLIKAAVLLTFGRLYEDRETATLTDAVKNILHRYRDPALA